MQRDSFFFLFKVYRGEETSASEVRHARAPRGHFGDVSLLREMNCSR